MSMFTNINASLLKYGAVTSSILLCNSASMAATDSSTTDSTLQQVIVAPDDQATELFEQASRVPLPNVITPAAVPTVDDAKQALARNPSRPDNIDYDIGDLIDNPELFTKYLNLALAAKNVTVVKQLLPYYRSLSVNDPNLIHYADAMVYSSEGKHKQAIGIYRDMLAEDPTLNPVRLEMALVMLKDKQYMTAQNQLRRLKGEPLPEPIMKIVDRALARIENVDDWRFNATVGYISNDNVNGAPETNINTRYGKVDPPIEANGLQVSASAQKRINLPNNFYANVGANAFAKGYWDESDYNDYLLTLSTSVGYDDAKNDVSIAPFVTQRIYDEQPYSTRSGVTLRASRWVRPKLKLSASGTLSNESFDDDKNKKREADGQYVGVNAFYTYDAQTYFYGGIGYYDHDVDDIGFLNYDRSSINVGWGREWTKGVSTLANVSFADKQYDDPIDSEVGYYRGIGAPLGVAREDKTTSVNVQLWKRDWQWLGLTPRLIMSYDMTESNYAYYDRDDKAEATIQLTKSF